MNRKLSVLLLILAVTLPLYALPEGWYLKGQRLDQHEEIVWGFLPTYLQGGAGYRGAPLMEGNSTSYELILGAGYVERKLWQDPVSGRNDRYRKQPLTYDVAVFDWSLEMRQGFLDSPVKDGDLLYAWVEYRGRYEKAFDSMAKGHSRDNYTSGKVLSLDGYLGEDYDGTVYPDLAGNHGYLGNSIALGFRLDYMVDTVETMDGLLLDVAFEWGPEWLNGALDGKADFYALTFDAVGAKTLYQYKRGSFHWFSVQLVDRLSFNLTSGDKVPVYMERLGSLGRRLRGFNTYSYASEVTVVNNFEVRLTGPMLGVDWIYPRLAVFLDLGYGAGKYYNSDYSADNFLASAGGQLSVTFFDFIDLGFTCAYLANGHRYDQDNSSFSFQFMFFLDY